MVAAAQRLIRVEHIMGTAIGIDVRDERADPALLDAAFGLLRGVDARFSTYRDDSEVCRLGRGEIDERECSAELAEVLGLCEEVRVASGGAFDVRRHRPDGGLDPSGLVKGWAVQRATEVLVASGLRNFCVNAGGDVCARGEPSRGRTWHVGIRDPRRADAVVAVIGATDLAVATSGLYERGDHVLDPRTGHGPRELLSVTVTGPSLTYADAYATAALVLGRAGVEWIAGLPGYSAYAVTPGGRGLWTEAMDRLLVRD